MNIKRKKQWLVGGIVAVGVVGGTVVHNSAHDSFRPAKKHSSALGTPVSEAGPTILVEPAVQGFASSAGVTDMRVLVSAGSGSDSSAVIVGTNAAGNSCWTVVSMGGAGGAPFNCGTAPGEEPGESASQQTLHAGCETSGSAESAIAQTGSCIGFVGSNVSSVDADLVDGTTQSLTITGGAFAYAATETAKLPTAFVARDASGQVVGQQDIVLAKG